MGEERLIPSGRRGLSPKKTRREISVRAVASLAVLQALFCCTLPAKSLALPRLSQPHDESQLPLTMIQNDGAKLAVRNVSSADSGPIALDLKVNLGEISGYAFLMFRGVPEEFNFTSGFRVKKSWVVSLRDLDDLQLVPPKDYVGQLELTVLLVRGRNETVESRKMLVSFGGADARVNANLAQPNANELLTSALPAVSPEEKLSAASAKEGLKTSPSLTVEQKLGLQIPSELKIAKDQEQKLLERAANLVQTGEISSARLMFEHLARQGSGLGALALAQTYDPIYFRAMKTLGGPTADVEKALMWYHIAAELGQKEADSRLSALSSN
jgi:hypothetical protein